MTKAIALMFAALAAGGCLMPKGLGGDGSTGSGSSANGGGDAGAPVMGGGCFQDPGTGAVLCRALSSCPDVIVDGEAFPTCGFKVNGSAIDLECGCNDSLCPMGAAGSCAQASMLLRAGTEADVCNELAEGKCTAVSASTGATNPSCDTTCAGECGGDPGCITLCGC